MFESATAAVPPPACVRLAMGSIAASLLLMLRGRCNVANFIGVWAPTIVIMVRYNKTVKQHGSDCSCSRPAHFAPRNWRAVASSERSPWPAISTSRAK